MTTARRRRAVVLTLLVGGLTAIGATALPRSPPLLVYNASASVAPGFYRQLRAGPLRPGDLVLAHLPPAVAKLAHDRGYLPADVPLLKPVAALPGDHVCAGRNGLAINGRTVAHARDRDRLGRPLAAWRGCRQLTADEVLLLSTGTADSFDGRYFGPLPIDIILITVTPLWTGGLP